MHVSHVTASYPFTSRAAELLCFFVQSSRSWVKDVKPFVQEALSIVSSAVFVITIIRNRSAAN